VSMLGEVEGVIVEVFLSLFRKPGEL